MEGTQTQASGAALFSVDDGGDVIPMQPGYLHYRCEVYGGWSGPPDIEEDENYGWFTGEQGGAGGQFTFQPSPELGHGPPLYLFPEEVIAFGRI